MMDTSRLEVADIFRQEGSACRQQHAESLSRGQRCVMSAIERCRTADLGGHVEECAHCGHQRIANHRLIDCVDGKVRFHWKDYRHDSRQKVMSLEADEFIHRFLLHVLPSGFQRIRHYGFLANRYRAVKLAQCRQGSYSTRPLQPSNYPMCR